MGHLAKYILPELLLLFCAVLVLSIELTRSKNKNLLSMVFSVSFFLGSILILITEFRNISEPLYTPALFHDSYLLTPLIILAKGIVLLAGLLTILASFRYVEIHEINLSEYLSFLTFSILGMFVLLSANDFILLFLGLELLSFPIYVLTGIKVKNERSCEASVKYMLMGAFSSAILLFGIGLIYGAIGTINLAEFTKQIAVLESTAKGLMSVANAPLVLGLVLLLVGLGFKLSLVPFHAWTPDVYEGAPTTITAFMSVTIKVAVFMVFIRILYSLHTPVFIESVAVLALLSIIIGNFYGLVQQNLKRLIAYSSIAHAGYILLGFLDPIRHQGTYAMVFYLINYTFMNLAALFVLVYLTTREKYVENIPDLKGIGWKYPMLGLVMLVAVFSLAGLPPTPGFIAKFYIFKSALQGGYVITVVLALVSTLISLYYYIKILTVMYMEDTCVLPEVKEHSLSIAVTMAIAVIALFYVGIFPNQILGLLP